MPKKKFIDRKKAVTFHLVHRSQQDPLTADDTAPQRVLVPEKQKEPTKQIDEQHKFGIYYDDDYDYMQHLREAGTMEWEQATPLPKTEKNDKSKLALPSSVFASEVEEEVGMLNKAAPESGLRLDLDPDLVAAMDEDFDYDDPENELEDDFINLANAECSEEEEGSYVDSDGQYEDEERDEVGSLNGSQFSFQDEETKSRFTDYSMSSSVIRRNKQLTLLDDRFEKLYAAYDDNEIGPLDCEEIEGYVPESSDILLQYANEFAKQQEREKLDKSNIADKITLQDSDSDSGDELVGVEIKQKEKWDCESILSTYSNIYNHPKLISEPKVPKIKIDRRTGIPVDSSKLTTRALAALNEGYDGANQGPRSAADTVLSTLSMLSIRPSDESPEEKKERKRLLKEYRRSRREERKQNTQMFKEESKRLVKVHINNRNNVQGNKIL